MYLRHMAIHQQVKLETLFPSDLLPSPWLTAGSSAVVPPLTIGHNKTEGNRDHLFYKLTSCKYADMQ